MADIVLAAGSAALALCGAPIAICLALGVRMPDAVALGIVGVLLLVVVVSFSLVVWEVAKEAHRVRESVRPL